MILDLKTKIRSNTKYVVLCWYDYGQFKAGDIISQHKTWDAANQSACKHGGCQGIRDVNDIIAERNWRVAT